MRTLSTISLLCCVVFSFAQQAFNGGQLTVSNVAKNAVRVQFTKGEVKSATVRLSINILSMNRREFLTHTAIIPRLS